MKIIKIILGLTLLSSSLMAEDIKLKWKGCSDESMILMYMINSVTNIRYNKHHGEVMTMALYSTQEDPWIMDKELYTDARKAYDIIYLHSQENTIFSDYLPNELNFTEVSIQQQNSILDGMISSIYIIDCMEVIK